MALVLVIVGSPDRSSDHRCPHQPEPRYASGVGEAAAQAPRFSDGTNACGAREVEGNVGKSRDLLCAIISDVSARMSIA
jgi:hypothetical protein